MMSKVSYITYYFKKKKIYYEKYFTDMNLLDAVPLIFKERNSDDYSATILQHVRISSTIYYENMKESIVDHLNIQLQNSIIEKIDGTDCPYIKSDQGTKLIVKHLEEAAKRVEFGKLEEYAVSVWSLCLALWGDQEELIDRDPSSHFSIMFRRTLFSEWLENTLTDQEILTQTITKTSYLEQLLELVMCHKVIEACELAFKYDDVNLSLLLAQLSSGPTVRQLMEDQLAAWHRDAADTFISVQRLKLFMLVAGVSLMESHHGAINTLEGIEWIKVLAVSLFFWFCICCSGIFRHWNTQLL